MATQQPPQTLVADVNDRIPFASSWDDLTAEHVRAFLASTDDDESLRWEAKGVQVHAGQVAKAVAAFANRDGGYLIIGASRDETTGVWRLDGAELPGSEPRTWVSTIIRERVRPAPMFDVHAWKMPGGKAAAVVQVQPNTGLLSVAEGRVYYRRAGESSFIENGGELQTVQAAVQFRSRAAPGAGATRGPAPRELPATLELGADLADETFSAVARRVAADGRVGEVNVFLSGAAQQMRGAIDDGDQEVLEHALDQVAVVAAGGIAYGESSAISDRAIRALHEVFDYSLRRRGSPIGIGDAEVWINVLSRARAVGGLAMRLDSWASLRPLVLHEVDIEGPRLWPTWFRYGDIQISRAQLYTAGDSVLEGSRMPLRLAARHALRLPALRPDSIEHEDALITSACQFDFAANVMAVWNAVGDRPGEAAFPYFAAWDGDRVRPVATRLIADGSFRAALLSDDAGDDGVALVLRFVAQQAGRMTQGLGSWGFWDGFTEGRVDRFLAEHPPR